MTRSAERGVGTHKSFEMSVYGNWANIEVVDLYNYHVYYDNKDKEYVVMNGDDERVQNEDRYEYENAILDEMRTYYLDLDKFTKKDLQNALCDEIFDDEDGEYDEEHGNGVREQITRAIKKFWQNDDKWTELCEHLRITVYAVALV